MKETNGACSFPVWLRNRIPLKSRDDGIGTHGGRSIQCVCMFLNAGKELFHLVSLQLVLKIIKLDLGHKLGHHLVAGVPRSPQGPLSTSADRTSTSSLPWSALAECECRRYLV